MIDDPRNGLPGAGAAVVTHVAVSAGEEPFNWEHPRELPLISPRLAVLLLLRDRRVAFGFGGPPVLLPCGARMRPFSPVQRRRPAGGDRPGPLIPEAEIAGWFPAPRLPLPPEG